MTDTLTAPDLLPVTSGYAPVNGLQLYYELYRAGQAGASAGQAAPLILLHGGFGTASMFAELRPRLAQGRQVIAVELQAHGHTADIDRPLSFEALAGDLAALAEHLRLPASSCAGLLFRRRRGAANGPALPEAGAQTGGGVVSGQRRGLVSGGAAGMQQVGPQTAELMKPSPLYAAYAQVAPRVQDWPVLATKLGELMRRPYDWTAEVAAMQVPTLVVTGDADSFSPLHAAEVFGLLGGGQKDPGWNAASLPAPCLAILPGTTHYDILSSPLLPLMVTPFLDE